MRQATVELPKKLTQVFAQPRGDLRYRGSYGGRGSAKSRSFALMSAVFGLAAPLRILATREYQNSIKESFHAEVKNAIEQYDWLRDFYEVGENYVRGRNGTEYLFKGLRHNMDSIKSMSNIDLCIVEEAESVPEKSWRDLTPTIRAPGSEIWVIWNPLRDGSPVDNRFRKRTPARSCIVEMNADDNPFLPNVLREEREEDRLLMDPQTFAHVWEGDYLRNSDAQVFANKLAQEAFEPGADWDGPYFGLDFGFAQDPTAAVKCWIHKRRLFIEFDGGRRKLELNDTGPFLREQLPGIEDYVVRGDSARPESISHIKAAPDGLPRLIAVKKWAGSVLDGVAHMKSYEKIVVHPRCKATWRELLMYSYKTDRLTGDILSGLIETDNHYIDATRYALEPLIRRKRKKVGVW